MVAPQSVSEDKPLQVVLSSRRPRVDSETARRFLCGKEQILHLLLLLVSPERERGLLAGIREIKPLALLNSVLPKMSLGQPALPTGKYWSE